MTVLSSESRPLAQQASRAAFWNLVLLPLLGMFNLAFSVLIRRRFGLLSGIYDILLGLMSVLLHYSSVGIPTGLSKFLPEIGAASGSRSLRRFLRHAVLVRLLLLGLLLIPLNFFAELISQRLEFGSSGVTYIRLLSGLVIARAIMGLVVTTLNAFFAQVWSNLFSLAQAALELGLVGLILLLGYEMEGVLSGLLVSAVAVSFFAAGRVTRELPGADQMGGVDEAAPQGEVESGKLFEGEARRFFFFSGFTYVFGLTTVFTDMGFAAPALAVILAPEQVALFATAFKLSLMTVGLVVAGFRGVYRPLFARLRIRNNPEELRQAFTAVSKAQLVVLVPAGVGLMVMCGDFIPLLFGAEFLPSVPIAWVLVAFMYSATAFNLPEIILSVDEQYRALGWARVVFLISVPLFVVVAAVYGLVGAAAVLGGARFIPSFWCYLVSRRLYGIRFPWKFVGRIAIVSGLMGVVLIVARVTWMTSPFEAVTLTVVGVLVYCIGLRITKALGSDEVDLLQRIDFPGQKILVAWLAPSLVASRRLSR